MPPKGRVGPVTAGDVHDLRSKARAFVDVAVMVADDASAPAYRSVSGSMAVLAAIAASDAICGHVLGVRSRGEDHGAAADLLATAGPEGVSWR